MINNPYQFGMTQFPFQPQPQLQQVTMSPSNIQYVNGFESAKNYQMSPNSSAILMDSEEPIFYLKKSDASGFCTTKKFKFEEINNAEPSPDLVTHSEFNSLSEKVEFILKKLKCEYEPSNASERGVKK